MTRGIKLPEQAGICNPPSLRAMRSLPAHWYISMRGGAPPTTPTHRNRVDEVGRSVRGNRQRDSPGLHLLGTLGCVVLQAVQPVSLLADR